MKLVAANSSPRVTGIDELPGKSNYFVGNDPKQWRTNVLQYARVKYENVYQGVDVVYYGNQQELEYDFIVAPGANPATIKLSFAGAQSIEIDERGDLVLRTQHGKVVQRKPFIYQETGGQKRQVAGQYVKIGSDQVGFEVGEYDNSLPLVIDPLLVYSTYLGGSGAFDIVNGLATDQAGNVYIVGDTSSPNFPTTAGSFQPVFNGSNPFVMKLDQTGSVVLYSTYLGGSGGDSAVGIAVDSAGNAYVGGHTSSTNFPVTPGAFDFIGDPAWDAFVAKLNPTGTALVYSSYLGGGGTEQTFAIAIDSLGQAYLTGGTKSLNFPVTFGVVDTTFNGDEDVFVTKVNSTGTAIAYATFLGGTNREQGVGIAVDVSGNAYVTGFTQSPNFPTSFGGWDTVLNGTDVFVVKLNSIASGGFSTFLGGTADEIGFAIAVDGAGFAYVTGYTGSTNFPTTTSAYDRVMSGWNDIFVTKLNQNFTGLVYSTFLGGTAGELAFSIAVDGVGQAYVTGYTLSTNFPTTPGAPDTTHNGNHDVIVTKFNQWGSGLLHSTYHGGSADDIGRGIALDPAGGIYVGGYTYSSNFPVTPGAVDTTYDAGQEGFVSKFQF